MIRVLFGCLVWTFCAISFAAIEQHKSKIDHMLQSDDSVFGGCMVYTLNSPATAGLDCSNWVTFSCSGDFSTKEVAYRKMDLAQMAYVMEKEVVFFINDQKKHNGFCFVERVDIRAER